MSKPPNAEKVAARHQPDARLRPEKSARLAVPPQRTDFSTDMSVRRPQTKPDSRASPLWTVQGASRIPRTAKSRLNPISGPDLDTRPRSRSQNSADAERALRAFGTRPRLGQKPARGVVSFFTQETFDTRRLESTRRCERAFAKNN